MNREALFKSDREDWETPHELYAELDKEFHFTLDPCSNDDNCKCKNHFTKEKDGLAQTWGGNECSVIHLTAGNLPSGYARRMRKLKSRTPLSLCSFLLELIQSGFTITSMVNMRFVFCVAG